MAESITKEQIAHVAHLARLELSDEELATYTRELSDILEYVNQLSAVDTVGVVPVAQVTGLVNVLRDDTLGNETIDRESFLAGAPAAELPYVKVKAVLE